MDPNDSGDHHEVQAAAGRAVGGGPPSSARAAVSARASSLPPPAPSATDAAVQTRATDSEDPTPPPASAASATAFGIENPPSDGEESPTPAPIDAIAAAHEEMEVNMKKSLKQTQSEDAPLPPLQIAALANKERGDDEKDGKKTTEAREGSPPTLAATSLPQVQGEAITTPTPSVDPPASPLPSADHGQSLQSRQQQIPVMPPPQTMLQPQDGDTGTPSVPVSPHRRESLVSVLDATLVEVPPEAIVVPDLPVYDAVPVGEQALLRTNKKYLIGAGIGSLIGAAVAAGVAVTSKNGTSGNEPIDPKGVVLSTASPSGIPSLHPTHSVNPSQPPSRSLHPSLSPSTSASPTPFCFGGEINILTDLYPEETSWTLSRIDNVDGVANSKVVLEGSPEKEGYRTSDEVCLERGDYEFAIFDSCGDGISYPGYYNVVFDGVVIAQGGGFESEDKVSFSVPLPSPPPSESSSPSELPSASFQPSQSIVPSQSLSPSFRPSNSFSPSTYWSTLNWNRRGLGFNGDAPDNGFGRAVAFSADALTIAVGAPSGYVKVYRREGEGSIWEQRGNTIRGEAKGDNFGRSLALSEDGTTLSIGAPGHDSVGSDSGQVKVYEWDEATLSYVQIGNTLYGTASGDEFGWSLDITSGRILAVGADYSDANGIYSGQVTIYAWDEVSSNFQQRGEVINGDAAYDRSGYSVSLAEYGQRLAVGAPTNDSNGRESGQVRVFEWDEATSNYKQFDSLFGDAAGDEFGRSVSLSRDGTTLAIGAPRNSENGQWSGQVKVFAWDETASNFVQIGQSLYGKAAYDRFGHSVALSSAGKTLAIRADQPVADKPGYVEVYGWDQAVSHYKLLGQSLGGETSGDTFGYALALAGNGRDLAVGAPENDRNGTDSGRVEVFEH